MKRTLFAAAVCGALSAGAHAQSSVSLYGLIDTGIVYVNNAGGHSNWLQSGSSTQNTVFGLKGTEDLGGGLHALFRLEQGFNLNNGSEAFAGSMFGSQAWVGLEHERYGTLTLGRQFDVFNDTVGPLTSGYNT
ncbi:TPA: porin, partial [Burkholderia vietnamiensis]|nr:porin [Burkholderia vietnamiensis]HDR8980670.1 porin [Burkholderia vietnamiensis]